MPRGNPKKHFTARYNKRLFERVMALKDYLEVNVGHRLSQTDLLEEAIRIGVGKLEHQKKVDEERRA